MRKSFSKIFVLVVIALFSLSILGCAVRFQKRHPRDIQRIEQLSQRLTELQDTKEELEGQLQEEISRGDVSLKMHEKGLVLTVVDRVLFDSGKAEVRPDGKKVLGKVGDVLGKIDENIIIEGHTDNVPIKYSSWESNWELSSHRALSVLHYFVDDINLNPERFSAVGYGPYRPVASNATAEGQQKNRRVEIVVVPAGIKKIKRGREIKPAQQPEAYIK